MKIWKWPLFFVGLVFLSQISLGLLNERMGIAVAPVWLFFVFVAAFPFLCLLPDISGAGSAIPVYILSFVYSVGFVFAVFGLLRLSRKLRHKALRRGAITLVTIAALGTYAFAWWISIKAICVIPIGF